MRASPRTAPAASRSEIALSAPWAVAAGVSTEGSSRAEEGVEAAVDAVGARAGGLRRLAQSVADPAWELGIRVGEERVVEAVAGVEGQELEARGDRGAVEAGEVGEQVRTRAEARLDVHLAVAGDGGAEAHGVGGAAQALAQGVLHISVIGKAGRLPNPLAGTCGAAGDSARTSRPSRQSCHNLPSAPGEAFNAFADPRSAPNTLM